ncbi:MAG: response regulator transcription factor [Amphiplicatus sp.]
MTDFHIVIVDDDEAIRDSLSAFLSAGGRRITSFADGEQFLDAQQDPPDLLFLDLKMPGLSGLEILRRLNRPAYPVIMISAHADISVAVQAIKLGATDFVEKPFAPEEVEATIEQARRSGDSPSPTPPGDPLGALTEREREIALALNEGLTNKEIARNLDISPRTVEVHRARVFEKVGVRNVAGLVRLLAGL